MAGLPTGTVTFCFTDIEGSTRLLQGLKDGYPRVLATHAEIVRAALAEHGGVEVSTEGDSFFAVFSSAPAAVAAAVAVQRGLNDHEWGEGVRVRVRIGLHTGEGILADGNYVGIDVHRAARIGAAGHGGQVLLSASTHALASAALPDGVSVRDLGEHRLKDLAAPERLYQLAVPGLQDEFPALKSLDARPNNLPAQMSTFVGRVAEIARIREILKEARLVTLTGPGGMGKTRLSLEVAAESLGDFAHGVFFVPLAAIFDPDLVPTTIAQALRIPEDPTRPTLDHIAQQLEGKKMLIVLDNFEQILAGAAAVAELMSRLPALKLIVTSREMLHLSGEQEFAVPPLGLPDPAKLPSLEALTQYEAVALFIDRAASVRTGFEVTSENAPAVAEICARLDGLPLAIELAAARVRLFSPQAMLARFESRFGLLGGGARDLPARQQTLRAAIGWSYDLLNEAERTFFRRLSAFVGGFSYEAADEVSNPERELGTDTLDLLASLVDKSLVRSDEVGTGEPRFRLLHVIREFGLELLDEDPAGPETARRHARFFLDLAERAETLITGVDAASWLDLLQLEHDNLRAVLQWSLDNSEAEVGLRIGAAVWRFWQQRGHLREGREWLEELLSAPSAAGTTVARGRGMYALASIFYWQSDFEAALVRYEETLQIYETAGHESGVADVVHSLAFLAAIEMDYPRARELYRRARELYEATGNEVGAAWDYLGEGMIATHAGDYDEARALLDTAQSEFVRLGDTFGLWNTLICVARIYRYLQQWEEARKWLIECLAVVRPSGDRTAYETLFQDFAAAAAGLGHPRRAMRLMGAADRMREEVGGGAPEALAMPVDVRAMVADLLSPEEIDAAYEEGRALPLEAALDYAIEEIVPARD